MVRGGGLPEADKKALEEARQERDRRGPESDSSRSELQDRFDELSERKPSGSGSNTSRSSGGSSSRSSSGPPAGTDDVQGEVRERQSAAQERRENRQEPSSMQGEMRMLESAADRRRPDVRDEQVQRSLRSSIAERTGVDEGTIDVRRADGEYVAEGPFGRATLGRDVVRERLMSQAAEDPRFGRGDFEVRDVPAGFTIGLSDEAVEDYAREQRGYRGQLEQAENILDTGAFDGPTPRQTSSSGGRDGVLGRVDEELRERTDGEVGLSDDFTSRDDTGGVLNTLDYASGGYFGGLYERSRTSVTPHAALSLDDPDALSARREKDRRFADLAAGAVDAIGTGEAPSLEEVGGLVYTTGEMTERAIMDAGAGISRRSPTRGMGPSVFGEQAGDIPGHLAEGVIGGVGAGVGAGLQLVPSAADDVSAALDEERTAPGTHQGNLGMARSFGESQVGMVRDRPVSTGILFGLPLVQGVPAGIRGFRSTRGTTGKVRFSEISSRRGVEGDLPQFETSTSARTSRAVGEIRTRARNQPGAAQRATGTQEVLWHSTEAQLGPEFTATRGGSELPGLFVSPDASPLRLSEGGSPTLRQRLRPSRPDLSTQPDRLAAFEGDRVAGMPESATGSGRIRDPTSGEWMPDPAASGARFLEGQAEAGTAYVRPTGSRTTELEAIFPPGSEFGQTTRLGVEMPSGRTIPADVFRRAGESAEVQGSTATSGGTTTADIMSGYTTTPDGPTGLTSLDYGTALGASGRPIDVGDATSADSTPSASEKSPRPSEPTLGQIDISATSETMADSTSKSPGASTRTPTATTSEPTAAPTSGPPTSAPTSPTPGAPTSRPSYPTSSPPREPELFTPFRPRDDGRNRQQERDDFMFGATRDPEYTDFLDPLSGDVLETERSKSGGWDDIIGLPGSPRQDDGLDGMLGWS